MTVLRLTLATLAATIVLLFVGHASPGPAHQALAGVVGLLTVFLVVQAWRDRRDRTLRRPALLALGLVLAQGAYGALAARGRLPGAAAAGLVALSMSYLLALVYLAVRAWAGPVAAPPPVRRGVVLAAALLLAAQVVLGAVVRYSGAGTVCGTDVILCDGRFWPGTGLQSLHLAHRYLGWILLLVLGGAHVVALRAGRRLGRPLVLHLARLAPILVTLQIGLGVWGVVSWTDPRVIAAHLAVAGLLVADFGALYFALGPLGQASRRRDRAPAPAAPPHAGEVLP